MAKTKAQLRTENSNNFPNNNSQFITPEKLREFNNDIIDAVALEANTELNGTGSFSNLSGSGYVSASEFIGDGSKLTGVTSTVPAGTVSGSSQVILTDTTGNLGGNRITGSVSNAISSSYAITASHALNAADADWNTIQNKPSGIVSGSSQVSYPDLSNIPSGIVSGSSQIILQDTTGDLSGSRIDGQVASALSSSYAVTASFALNAGGSDTGSLLTTASVSDATITFTKGDASQFSIEVNNVSASIQAEDLVITVKNTSGVTLPAGTAVKATGVTGENITIVSSSADNPSLMPAIGVLNEELTNNSTGECYIAGRLENINTSNLVAGAAVYVDINGGLTATKPTGSSLIQNIGIAAKIDGSEGELVIQGSGRSNDVPNIQEGYLWVGDANSVAQAVASSSLNVANATNAVNATNADNIALTADSTNTNRYVPFTATATGDGTLLTDAGLLYNPSSNTLTATTFNGDLSGNASTATTATSVSDVNVAYQNQNNTFTGTQSFDNISASGTFTASLTEGYVWAGGAGNVTELVATSSFGGGGGGIFEQTGSFYATTNDLQVTGSFGVQGAIGGRKETLTITSNTASIDLTTSNTYELTLVSSADTHLDVSTFGEDGQSINVLVKQPTSGNTGSISFSSDFKFGQGYEYVPTAANSSEDIVSFTRFGNFMYGTFINNFS